MNIKLLIGSLIFETDKPEDFIYDEKKGTTTVLNGSAKIVATVPPDLIGKQAIEVADWYDKKFPNDAKWNWEIEK